MSEQLMPNGDYNLKLPPVAPSQPGDELSVELLASPEIRDQLGEVQNQISGQYRELEAGGGNVTELFRGATGDGVMVAVAKYDGAANPDDPQASDSRLGYPPSGDRGYVVFVCMMDDLSETGAAGTPLEGKPLATTPRVLIPMRQIPGAHVLGFEVSGGHVSVRIPFMEHLPPKFAGKDVMSFEDAAFGERRTKLAQESLQWIIDAAIADLQSGNWATEEAKRERDGQFDKYYKERLDELRQHPEWLDDLANPLKSISDERLQELGELKGVHPDYAVDSLREGAAKYVKYNAIVDPDELKVIRSVMAPDEPDTRSYDSYYRPGLGFDDENRPINLALSAYRRQKLAEAVPPQPSAPTPPMDAYPDDDYDSLYG